MSERGKSITSRNETHMRLDQAIFVGVAKVSAEAAMSPDRHGILQAGIVKHRKAHVVLWLSHI